MIASLESAALPGDDGLNVEDCSFPFGLLASPAVVWIDGQALSASARIQAARELSQAESILSGLLRARCKLQVMSADDHMSAGTALRVSIAADEPACKVDIGMNLEAVRALASAFANAPRAVSVDLLKSFDFAAMEFLSLALAQCLADQGVRDWQVVEFACGGSDSSSSPDQLSTVYLRLVIPPLAGAIAIRSADADLRPLRSLGVSAVGWPRAADCAINVAVAFPSIPLNEEESKSIECGDLLLSGVSDLSSMHALAVVTRSGWRLSSCKFAEDSPTRMAVRIGALRPTAHPAWLDGDNRLVALIGERSLTTDELRAWDIDGLLDLPKNPERPALLVQGGRVVGVAEVERCDGQIAFRVLEWRGRDAIMPPLDSELPAEARR